jgi:hypothetical protein
MNDLGSTLSMVLHTFETGFTQPSFALLLQVVQGWILCPGRHTLTRIYALGRLSGAPQALDAYYRFFRCAKWSCHDLWRLLAQPLVARFYPTGPVPLQIDDTAFHKSGRRVEGAAWWRDAVRSTGTKVVHCFGLNLLVITLRIVPPWGGEPLGLPIHVRLHRKAGPTLLALAREMMAELATWFPERDFELVGDGFFATLAGAGLPRVQLYSRIRRDAALFAPPPKRGVKRRGRPRKHGHRLPTPKELSQSARTWVKIQVQIRGQCLTRLVHVRDVLWYAVCPQALIRLVIVRDPEGKEPDDYFFTTDLQATAAHVIETYAARWAIEDTFRNVKQYLGGQDPQLWKGQGPERAATFAFWLYSVVWLSYLMLPQRKPTWLIRVWYPQKCTPSFQDALAYWRRHLWRTAIFSKTEKEAVLTENISLAVDTLAYAA